MYNYFILDKGSWSIALFFFNLLRAVTKCCHSLRKKGIGSGITSALAVDPLRWMWNHVESIVPSPDLVSATTATFGYWSFGKILLQHVQIMEPFNLFHQAWLEITWLCKKTSGGWHFHRSTFNTAIVSYAWIVFGLSPSVNNRNLLKINDTFICRLCDQNESKKTCTSIRSMLNSWSVNANQDTHRSRGTWRTVTGGTRLPNLLRTMRANSQLSSEVFNTCGLNWSKLKWS